jgi:hypothetical protein
MKAIIVGCCSTNDLHRSLGLTPILARPQILAVPPVQQIEREHRELLAGGAPATMQAGKVGSRSVPSASRQRLWIALFLPLKWSLFLG